jgi:hypothetical protein
MKILKENTQTRIKEIMTGINTGVKSFCIITSENPMGQKLSNKENIKKVDSLKDYLRLGLFKYLRAKGKYGSNENPFIIININLEEAKNIGNKFNQESFIFAYNKNDKVIFEYWKKENNNYKKLDEIDHFKNVSKEQDDFYTSTKSWKINIPFSIFEDVNFIYEENYGTLNSIKKDTIDIINSINVYSEGTILKKFYENRAYINYLKKSKDEIDYYSLYEEVQKFPAFWAKGSKVYNVDEKHIRFILDNPEIFGLTKEELLDIYKKHNEKIGLEGKAREEIIKKVSKNGWIRVRHYSKPNNYWTIQVDNFRKRKKSIDLFIDWAMENAGMDFNDAISFIGFDDNYSKNYSFQEGGLNKYLGEENLDKKEKINKIVEEVIKLKFFK